MKSFCVKYLSFKKITLLAFILMLLYLMPWQQTSEEQNVVSFEKQLLGDNIEDDEGYFDVNLLSKNSTGENSTVDENVGEEALNRAEIADGVIIFSAMDSGSNELGELLNQFPKIFYLFEPLHPFGWSANEKNERMRLLQDIMICDFRNIPKQFMEITEKLNLDDSVARCLKDNVCFYTRSNFLHRDTNLCNITEDGGSLKCQHPFPTNKLGETCRESLFPAVKIIAEQHLESLDQVTDTIPARIRIVHIVRDPRSILAAQSVDPTALEAQAIRTCSLLLENVEYGKSRYGTDSYLLVRYEELLSETVDTARRLYDFLGITDQSSDVLELIGSKVDPVKATMDVVAGWRNKLDFESTMVVQRNCQQVLKDLGYAWFESQIDQRNMSRSVLE